MSCSEPSRDAATNHDVAAGQLDVGPPLLGTVTASSAAYPSSHVDDSNAANPNDPEQLSRVVSGPPYSVFTPGMKRYIIIMVTFTSFISPMTANIYFPALVPIAVDLDVSIGLINLTVTTFMIFQGIAPTLVGDFGDMAGRRPAFVIALAIYLVVNIGLALQKNFAALLVLRMLQSAGSSGTLALGFAVVADVAVSAERGKYMGIVGAGINVGPALSPVLGGILAQYLGWRSIFWFCCIVTACLLIPYILLVPETARNVVGNGSIPPRWINMTLLDFIRQRRHPVPLADRPQPPKTKIRFPNPLRTLSVVLEKDLSLILAYTAILYVVFIMIVATLSTIFTDIYHLNELQIGLCYLPYGVGCCTASILQGHLLDWNYRRTARKIGFTIDYRRGDDLSKFPIEQARLYPMAPMVALGVCTVIAYGWVLEYRLPLAVPLVLIFFVGLFVVGSFSILSTLIMDLYPQAPATAVAAVNLVRCLFGAAVMVFIESMMVRLGRGWNFTFWALLVVVTSPTMLMVLRWGPGWREARRLRLAKKRAQHEEEREAREQAAAGQRQEVPGEGNEHDNHDNHDDRDPGQLVNPDSSTKNN
ncbi:uncharacterized protein SPSK_07321 [Sporothrix schenckii 1099-18]|uniref:Major facilitator superfamily (MFS) profile domain-containing protein n=1 Tax=Sporothrix schenckii 1099-18 TaxID=1397361 RepID=A0A0F2ME56_SPOSC|nr:uncharacterized protein SPSK_07321 [Sporothrix schenckii 1099-18]KJR87943.1 hypothetical protein SPSK_07321 [Sporothrix schenckii 1099-18]